MSAVLNTSNEVIKKRTKRKATSDDTDAGAAKARAGQAKSKADVTQPQVTQGGFEAINAIMHPEEDAGPVIEAYVRSELPNGTDNERILTKSMLRYSGIDIGPHLSGPYDPSPAQQAIFIPARLDGTILQPGASTPRPSDYTVRAGMLVFTTKTAAQNSNYTWSMSGSTKRRLNTSTSLPVMANWHGYNGTQANNSDDIVFVGVVVDNVVDGLGAQNNPTSIGSVSVMVSGAVTVHCGKLAAAELQVGKRIMYEPEPEKNKFRGLPSDFAPVKLSSAKLRRPGSLLTQRIVGRVLETFPDQGAVRILLETPRVPQLPPTTAAAIRRGEGLLRGPIDGLAPKQPVFVRAHVDARDAYQSWIYKPHHDFMPAGVLAFTYDYHAITDADTFNADNCRKVFSCIAGGITDPDKCSFVGVTVDPHPAGGKISVTVSGSVTIHVEPAELATMSIGDFLAYDVTHFSEAYQGHPEGYTPARVIRYVQGVGTPTSCFARLLGKADNERIGEAHVLLLPPITF
jgi:hypothetical protein